MLKRSCENAFAPFWPMEGHCQNCTKSLNRITKVRIFEQGRGYTMNFYYTSRLNFVLFLA